MRKFGSCYLTTHKQKFVELKHPPVFLFSNFAVMLGIVERSSQSHQNTEEQMISSLSEIQELAEAFEPVATARSILNLF